MLWTELLPLLGLGGLIGGVVGAFFQSKFQHQKQIKEYEHELKKKRYLSINIFLLAKLDTPKGLYFIANIRPDITNEELLDKEIEVEYFNAYLFANDEVLMSLKSFINNPSYAAYYLAASAMRKDLWGKNSKTNISPDLSSVDKYMA